MTSFAKENKAKAKQGDGQSWLSGVKDELAGVFARCVSEYDGESVEDFTLVCHEASWQIVEKKLKESFMNGKRSRGHRKADKK